MQGVVQGSFHRPTEQLRNGLKVLHNRGLNNYIYYVGRSKMIVIVQRAPKLHSNYYWPLY